MIDGILGNYNNDNSDDFIVNGASYSQNMSEYFNLYKYLSKINSFIKYKSKAL